MTLNLIWNNLVHYCLQIGLLVGLAAFIPHRPAPHHAAGAPGLLAHSCWWPASCSDVRAERYEVVAVQTQVSATDSCQRRHSARPMPAGVIPWNQIRSDCSRRARWSGCSGLRARARSGWLRVSNRRRSQPLQQPTSWAVGRTCSISEDVTSPVTFGFIDPVVLLPRIFRKWTGPRRRRSSATRSCTSVVRIGWYVERRGRAGQSSGFHPAIGGCWARSVSRRWDREAIEMTAVAREVRRRPARHRGELRRLTWPGARCFCAAASQAAGSFDSEEVRMSKTRSISALAAGLGILPRRAGS